MNPYLNVAGEALQLILILSLPPRLASLVVGVAISLLQALTQVQEQTLTFVPKIVATILALLIFADAIMVRLEIFTRKVFDMMKYVGQGM